VNKVIHEKLIFSQRANKCTAFHGTQYYSVIYRWVSEVFRPALATKIYYAFCICSMRSGLSTIPLWLRLCTG